MVKIKGYEDYELSATSFEVFSLKSGGWEQIKGEREGAHIYFTLYKNGHRKRLSLWQILQDNWDAFLVDFLRARKDH